MRIVVSGSAGIGKTTLINDFLQKWPMYKKSGETYREMVKEKKLKLNKKGNKESQEIILGALIDEVIKYTKKTDNVIHDRGPLDALIWSMWMNAKGKSDISDSDIKNYLSLVKKTMKFVDIIFYIPRDEKYIIEMENKENREKDEVFQKEIDMFFQLAKESWQKEENVFFPKDDTPPVIEIFGNREERLKMIELYISNEGKSHSENQSLLQDFLDKMKEQVTDPLLPKIPIIRK